MRTAVRALGMALLFAACGVSAVRAQSYSPTVITPPIVDMIEDNHVSLISGKSQFTIPAIKLGDVSFTLYSYNGPHFVKTGIGGVGDHNYGRIVPCVNGLQAGTTECTNASVQAIYGEERASFTRQTTGQYTPNAMDGASFVDNGSTCTWTRHDGTQIVFAAYRLTSSDPRCLSNYITQVISPDGRIATYYYYGPSLSMQWPAILSIATNSGYLLKYNYSGTPSWGGETSVVAINRAFERCDPAASSCTLVNTWPTATLSWQDKLVSVSDDLLPIGQNYNPYLHYLFTIEDQAHKKHVFEVDSNFRVVSYQPPEATSPVFYYTLCSLHSNGHTMTHCFGDTYYYNDGTRAFEAAPMLWDLVESVKRYDSVNGPTWNYQADVTPGQGPPGWSTWGHSVASPLLVTMAAAGNATPGTEQFYGPTEYIKHYDGTLDNFGRNTGNHLALRTTLSGIKEYYTYDFRANLWTISRVPIGSADHTIQQSAIYPEQCTTFLSCTCSNRNTCNKPTSVTDANQNALNPNQHTADFVYDPNHGGILKVTGPAVTGTQALAGIHPETRYTYIQRYAWYLNSSGAMTRETRPVWLLATESYCRSTAPASPGPGCTVAADEVVTTYEYGADSGPNNLIVRGKAVSADGQTLRTCYGHDKQGNKIWETSPNANLGSCPDY
jgi:hypothetical protein